MKEKKYPYIEEMLARFKELTKNSNIAFIEGYYQSYAASSTKKHLGIEYEKYLNFINKKAEENGLIRDGSIDIHGNSIFKK